MTFDEKSQMSKDTGRGIARKKHPMERGIKHNESENG
jgi:hypothetical protein